MKHLVVDCRMINNSGIGTYIKHILPGIIHSGNFKVTCLGYETLNQFEWFAKVSFVKINSRILSINEQLEVFRMIPRCDIYWAPNWNVPILPYRAAVTILTIHDVYHLANREKIPFLQYLLARVMFFSAIQKAARVITVSNFSKQEIMRHTGCKSDKIVVSQLAVANDFDTGFTKTPVKNNKYLLYVGNVKPHKNLANALKAFVNIERKDVYFYIIGKRDGFISGDNNINQLLQQMNERVVFTGEVDNNSLKNFYANASGFILPSMYEGFGLTLIEAMKFYIPIAASRAASIPEVGGGAVEYFNPHNVNEITEKLNKILNKDFKVNRAGYDAQLNKFSWNRTFKQHMDLLLSL